jgi:hypothetical protein
MKMTFFCRLARCGGLLHFSQAKILELVERGIITSGYASLVAPSFDLWHLRKVNDDA